MNAKDRAALIKTLTCHDPFCNDMMSPRTTATLSPQFGEEIQFKTKELFNAGEIEELIKLLEIHIRSLKVTCIESCGEEAKSKPHEKVPEGILKQWREYRRSLSSFLFRHMYTALALKFGIEPDDVDHDCQTMEIYPGIFDASKIEDALETLKWHLKQGDNNPFRPEATVDLAMLIRKMNNGRPKTLLEAFYRGELRTQGDVKKLKLKQSLSSLHCQVKSWEDKHHGAEVIPFVEKIQALPKK